MRVLTVVNVLGVMAGSVYAGLAFGNGYVPRFALGAALIFLIGTFWPFLREHAELRQGFDRVEEEFRTQKNRDLGIIRSEVFTNRPRRPIWKRNGGAWLPLALTAGLGFALLAADVAAFARHDPPARTHGRIITNF